MTKFLYNRLYFIFIALIIVLCDQLAKHIINVYDESLLNKDFIIFSLDNVKNFGAAFNLFSGNRIFLSLVSITITILLIYFILNKAIVNNLYLFSFSFVLGGTIGNGIDRVTKGYVIDFINLNFIDFPVFNIADLSINIGLLLTIYGFIKYKRY